jgi:hypothetical protein
VRRERRENKNFKNALLSRLLTPERSDGGQVCSVISAFSVVKSSRFYILELFICVYLWLKLNFLFFVLHIILGLLCPLRFTLGFGSLRSSQEQTVSAQIALTKS